MVNVRRDLFLSQALNLVIKTHPTKNRQTSRYWKKLPSNYIKLHRYLFSYNIKPQTYAMYTNNYYT